MKTNRALAILLLSTLSFGASAAIVSVDAGRYTFSYDDSFWGTSTFSKSGDVFTFSNLASSLGTSAATASDHPYNRTTDTFDVYRGWASIWVTADAGYTLNAISSGVKGSVNALAGPDPANDAGAWGWADVATASRWLLADGTYRSNSDFARYQETRDNFGSFLKTGTPGAFDIGSVSYLYGYVPSAEGTFTVRGSAVAHGIGSWATASADTAYFGISVAPIPEPETWAMFLAGLGILGVVTRRRRSAES